MTKFRFYLISKEIELFFHVGYLDFFFLFFLLICNHLRHRQVFILVIFHNVPHFSLLNFMILK